MGTLSRRFDSIVYGRGLCFGMVATALACYMGHSAGQPLSELSPDPDLIATLRRYHVRQYRPKVVLAAVYDWVRSLGGRPDRTVDRIRSAGVDSNPHVLCFGPGPDRNFFRCLAQAHAVVPYRIETSQEERRVYIYDPNYPRDRERCVVFQRDESGRFGEFRYDRFGTNERWRISLIPSRAFGVS
ncbi:MAG: hypothetical protein ACR2GU_15930 [Rubrobacteraceae bacterium]